MKACFPLRHLPLFLIAGLAISGCTTLDDGRSGSSDEHAVSDSSARGRATEASAPKSKKAGMLTACSAFPTGDPDTSAVLIEKHTPREVRLGEEFEYETRVVNLTALPLENVIVTETVAGGFEHRSSTPKHASAERGERRWMIGNLAPNEARSITVRGLSKTAESITSCVSVAYDTALCTRISVVEPTLKLVASGPAEVIQCDEIVFDYVVSNPGTGDAREVVVSGKLPEGLAVGGSSTFRKTIGALAAGQSVPFQVRAKASRTGRFVHTAEARSSAGLKSRSDEITTVVRKPKLEILHDGPERHFVGRDLAYEIIVKNVGDAVAREAVLEQVVTSSGVAFKSASEGGRSTGNRLRWNLGELKPNESRRVTARFDTRSTGSVSSMVTARAYCAQDATSSAKTQLEGIPATLLEVVDVEDPIEVGQNETYVITVTNQGTAPATGVKVKVQLPANTQLVNTTGATRIQGAGAPGRSFSLAPVASIAPKAKVAWRIVVRGVEAADARFRVSMTSDQLKVPVEETEATNFYE